MPHTFVVEGRTSFPIDMLRYDSCNPKTERDAGIIERTFEPRRGIKGRVEVTLIGERVPTEARWESFGWKVV